MGDDLDIDQLLEAAYNNKSDWRENGDPNGRDRDDHSRMDDDPDGERKRSRKDKKRSRSRDRKKRSRSRSRDRKKDRKRSRSRERKRSRDRRRRSRSTSKSRDLIKRRRSRSRSGTPSRLKLGPKRRKSRSLSPIRLEDHPMSPEERDARTVFCMQLSQRVRARDMEDFFSSVGKVRDVRMITCNKTRRFKGIAYVEFKDIESVALAIGLNGQKLLGVPIIVQPSQAEKNRAGQLAKAGAMAAAMSTSTTAPGPMKLYVGSLHFNITEDMLKAIFEPFGRIDEILLMKDHETGRSKGFGFITFHEGEDAKRAMEQLNGFEIAGRPMKVGYVTAGSGEYFHNPQTYLDTDDMDRAGVNLGVTGRLQLMAKLAEGTDLKIPEAAATALNMQSQISQHSYNAAATQGIAVAPTTPLVAPSIATQCFMLSNMFDPNQEANNSSFEREMRDDVIEACQPHGGAFHVFVDKLSPQGNVYVKCPSISAAVAAVNTLHGRWFAGRLITAAYVPLLNYHSLFPDAMACNKNL